jgi:hypothetical protein
MNGLYVYVLIFSRRPNSIKFSRADSRGKVLKLSKNSGTDVVKDFIEMNGWTNE